MSKSYADVLESYVIAEEGFFSNLKNKFSKFKPAAATSKIHTSCEKDDSKLKEEKEEAKKRIKSTYNIDVDNMSNNEILDKITPYILKDIKAEINKVKNSKDFYEKCKEEVRDYYSNWSQEDIDDLIKSIKPSMFVGKLSQDETVFVVVDDTYIGTAISFMDDLEDVLVKKYGDFEKLNIFYLENSGRGSINME